MYDYPDDGLSVLDAGKDKDVATDGQVLDMADDDVSPPLLRSRRKSYVKRLAADFVVEVQFPECSNSIENSRILRILRLCLLALYIT